MSIKNTHVAATEAIDSWIERVVIGLDICPFAGGVRRQGQLGIVTLEQSTLPEALQRIADEAASLLATGEIWNTRLLVFDRGFANFESFLDLYYLADDLLVDLGFEGQLQLASFHPDYQFEGTEVDDVSNWTNRAPFPVLHLLQEASVEEAVSRHPDPEGIPERNIERLNALGLAAVSSLAYPPE